MHASRKYVRSLVEFLYIPVRLIWTAVKNFKSRCEGLSPALFFFALFGNTTYALSICAKSMDRDYLVRNGGWLAGRIFYVLNGIGPWLMDDTQGVL